MKSSLMTRVYTNRTTGPATQKFHNHMHAQAGKYFFGTHCIPPANRRRRPKRLFWIPHLPQPLHPYLPALETGWSDLSCAAKILDHIVVYDSTMTAAPNKSSHKRKAYNKTQATFASMYQPTLSSFQLRSQPEK